MGSQFAINEVRIPGVFGSDFVPCHHENRRLVWPHHTQVSPNVEAFWR